METAVDLREEEVLSAEEITEEAALEIEVVTEVLAELTAEEIR